MAFAEFDMAATRQRMSDWCCLRRLQFAFFLLIAALHPRSCPAERPLSVFDEQLFEEPFAGQEVDDCEACQRESAAFDSWESVAGIDSAQDHEVLAWDDPALQSLDRPHYFGFRHSSTHGRHIGRGRPLEGTSWQNRPYHVDWFSGPLLGDNLINNRVAQDNEFFGGLRIGWDFDYYWGLEARVGWSKPPIQFDSQPAVSNNGSYFLSDIDLVYYPWGDSKIRPYWLLGAGMARIEFVDDTSVNFNTTLFTMPFGGGLQFRQWSWLAWRLEVLDNLSFGADGVNTMHNVSLTAGMEIRFGAHPASYWPWRSSRSIW